MTTRKPAKKPTKKKAPTPVEATVHTAATRTNIPTDELRDFVVADEANPPDLLYPRDPSLDPQLVWTGKDQLDREDLAVPSVPLYIQEKIDPRAIVENLRDTAAADEPEPELSLFDDFDGLTGLDQVEFYRHDANWSNRLILGDSLLVMGSLAEKENLAGQVQMIYLDPPYGIKFGSNWQISTRKTEVKDGADASRQPEQVKAFRDTWKDGIHSYLTYLRDRLTVARGLLTESGSMFVQIGDENVHRVRAVLDEVFGEENFVTTIIVKKKSATTPTDPINDYVLWVARDRSQMKLRQVWDRRRSPEEDTKFNTLIDVDGTHHRVAKLKPSEIESLLEGGARWARVNYPIVSQHPDELRSRDYIWNGKAFSCGPNKQWRFGAVGQMDRLAAAERLFDGGGKSLGGVVYWDDWPYRSRSNIWEDFHGDPDVIYVVQTNRKIIERCLLMTTDPGDLVLDPTCGSGSTAVVAEQWGRRWITTDTSRVALALARTRLMSARYPYYLLADSPEGAAKEEELTGLPQPRDGYATDVRQGFVSKRAPRVSLASIANNPDIFEGMSREEMDQAILRHADTELLVDQPFEDNKRVRVSGPFTVESLSPHRNLEAPTVESEPETNGNGSAGFVETILENLRSAGVQNTFRGERLKFDSLEPAASLVLAARGEFTDAHGTTRTVAVCIGPEHGTVSPDLVKDAAREALKGAGHDLLVVCGFAFEAYTSETAREFEPSSDGFIAADDERKMGRLRVLLTHMNPDLAMSDELLKKTGAGNLFTVFGQPDVTIDRGDDGIIVELFGVDVYDPTTGVVRPSSTDDIACWFIDTNYNGESFFVRHAYFTGADDPYDKLARALKADIDPDAWNALYRTESIPFPPPGTGRIAVKVINHYGDEILQVYDIPAAGA